MRRTIVRFREARQGLKCRGQRGRGQVGMVVRELQSVAGLVQWLGRKEAVWQGSASGSHTAYPFQPWSHIPPPIQRLCGKHWGVSGAERAGSVALYLAGREVTNV